MKTIDMTPTWRALIPALVEVAVRGTSPEGRKEAMDALYSLADFVDNHNVEVKAMEAPDHERDDVIAALCSPVLEPLRRGVSDHPNAFVQYGEIDGVKRLQIWPVNGGWLGVDLKYVEADAAPFSD